MKQPNGETRCKTCDRVIQQIGSLGHWSTGHGLKQFYCEKNTNSSLRQHEPATPSERQKEKQMEGLLMKYFVLKPAGSDMYARASRRAMRSYAHFIRQENVQLSDELRAWADAEWIKYADEETDAD